MRQLLLTIAFRGTAYHGWQVQQNAVSVAQVLQDAIQAVFGVRHDVKGCSRTDAGVHAAHFVVLVCGVENAIPCDRVVPALNVQLPADLAVLDCREVGDDFHPRYSATGKRYRYRIWNSPVKNPFEPDTALHHPRPLDITRMNAAALHLVGTHDFSAFCAAGGSVEDKVRTITCCQVERQDQLVTIDVAGNGFLYNMVRIIAGTLLEVSAGKLEPEALPAILHSRDRARAGATAPAHGLWLMETYY